MNDPHNHSSERPPASSIRRADRLGHMDECHGESYLKPYRDAVRQFGAGFHATLWSSREAQLLRFDVMIDLAGFDAAVVLDAGCGSGDFAAHLICRQVPFAKYVGIDAVPEMIKAAQSRDLDRCEFRIGDLIHEPAPMRELQPDFVCISGTLNTMEEATARRLVQAAFAASIQGTVFNFLSDRTHSKWSRRDIGPARRFNTLDWLNWALDQTSRVSFTQDYLDGHDATIFMRHE
jgi:SAM-dependent methyltransferase